MGWAEKLPSGRYRAVYRDADGRQRPAKPGQTFTHKKEAERVAGAAEDKARRTMRNDPDAAKRKWSEWAEEWWPTRTVEPGTLKVDAGRKKNYLEPKWGDEPLGSITRHDVKEWAAELNRRPKLSPSTVQRIVHLLSASLAAAVDAEIIDVNPASRIKLPKGAQEQERYLERDEYQAIVDQMPTTDDQLVAHLLTYTGLRWGEMAGLHWDRVDLKRGMLRVVETFDEKAGRIKAYPKGRRQRSVPMDEWLCELLDERPRAKTCGVEHASGRCRSGLVLTTEGGSVLRDTNWSPVWRDAVERAEVGHVRIHDCRHTYASWLLQDGVQLAEVGQLMGHVSPATTQKYAHLAETPSAAVLAALGSPRLGKKG